MAVNECDLLFSIGTRFNDRITGKLHSFAPNAQIVHIDIDTAAISKNVQVDVPIVADAKEAVSKCWNMYLSVRRRSGLDDQRVERGTSTDDEEETNHDTTGCDRNDQPYL